MSETSAEKLIANASATDPDAAPENTDSTVEEVDTQEVEETETEDTAPEDTEEQDSEEDDDLPEKVKDILSKNRKELRQTKAALKAAEKRVSELEAGNGEASESGEKFKKLYINNAAKSALVEAGLTEGTGRLLKLIDMDEVTVDEDGDISGLSEQIDDLKQDFKSLFSTPAKKAPVKSDGAGRREAPAVKKSSAEMLAARLQA